VQGPVVFTTGGGMDAHPNSMVAESTGGGHLQSLSVHSSAEPAKTAARTIGPNARVVRGPTMQLILPVVVKNACHM
jgi:hypothetical protein